MPEPLKLCYSEELVNSIANDCRKHRPTFENVSFLKNVLSDDWEALELKDRMHRLAEFLGSYLPSDFVKAIEIILPVANNYSGLAHMCFPDFVEQYGMDDFDTSMLALEKLTAGSSSEFAIRPFIVKYPEQAIARLKLWAKSDCEHIRRLASEGCRPRLPWAMALPLFKKNPTEVLEIILPLIDDESLYVRRSVANNLNDISKDNPKMLIDIAKRYLGKNKNIDWVIKHACRGLLKQGERETLKLFGYTNAKHVSVIDFISDSKVELGERIDFKF